MELSSKDPVITTLHLINNKTFQMPRKEWVNNVLNVLQWELKTTF